MTQRIVFNAPPEVVALLEAEQVKTGASVSEICRRAIFDYLKRDDVNFLRMTRAERNQHIAENGRRPPVLITPRPQGE